MFGNGQTINWKLTLFSHEMQQAKGAYYAGCLVFPNLPVLDIHPNETNPLHSINKDITNFKNIITSNIKKKKHII